MISSQPWIIENGQPTIVAQNVKVKYQISITNGINAASLMEGGTVFKQSEIEELSRIIKERIGITIYSTTGITLPDLDVEKLRRKGLIPDDPEHIISDSYVYGILTTLDPALASAPYSVVKAAILAAPLSDIEKEAINWLNANAATYCKGLGNTIDAATMRIVQDVTKEDAMRGTIRETLSDSAKNRKVRSEIVTQLRRATKDVQRDWHRIVNTEMHSARTQGISQGFRKQFGGGVTVIVRPHPDCCDLCRAAYLSRGIPKVFKLADLAMRNNVGRTAAELKKEPGLPPLHPYCMCEIMRFDPAIHTFDEKGRINLRKRSTNKV